MRTTVFARALAAAVFTALLLGAPAAAARFAKAPQPAGDPPELFADLDGEPIELAEVGRWYCHDFDYPAIHCFSDPSVLAEPIPDEGSSPKSAVRGSEAETGGTFVAAAAVNYVTVYDFTTYQGGYMHMSQDYSMLSLIGWNDRISSFVAHTSSGGVFWTDWLYTGTRYSFCCNQAVGSLGSFNDTFSSIFHN